MDLDLHLSSICRLCADNNPNGVLLFEENSPDGDIGSFINMYLPFKVQKDRQLPQTICPGCNIQLQAVIQFFDLVIEGQKKIRQMWKEQVTARRKAEKELSITVAVAVDPASGSVIKTLNNTGEHSYSQEEGEEAKTEAMEILLNEVENQLNIEVFDETGSMYASDDPLVLKAEGLDRPRKKRGRPKKVPQQNEPEVEDLSTNENSENMPDMLKSEELELKDEDLDGRRRRKRKVPQRYKEAVQGKELERMFREEGVIDEEDDKEVVMELVDDQIPLADPVSNQVSEVIGHLETQEGQDLGEVVVVNKIKARRKYPIRKKMRFQCDICGRGFFHRTRYLTHKKLHKGVKFVCTECQKWFSSREHFELHQKIDKHTGEAIIESLEEKEGKIAEDATKIDFNCKMCNKSFPSKRVYESHLSTEHQEVKPFQCNVCDKSFTQPATLKSHLALHDDPNSKEKGYPCNLCGKKLNHPSSVLYHREAEHNNGRRFVCNKCGKSFKHKQLLQRHQLVHSDNRPFSCTLCSASFKTKANLMNHHATHTGEKKHKCEHCGQQFAHKTSLTLHYRWHSGQKPYQCTVCKKMFSQKGNLQEHYRIHTGEKPFHCNICTRKFTTSSQFKLHMKRHTGERPWKCEYCGKSFLHKDAWKCHIRRHRGEKPFQCPHCSRDFPEQWALKKHMRLHTGERPYSCGTCGKTFADCSNLTKHKKVHARELKMGEEGGGQPAVDGMELSVWNIIQSHLQENAVLDKGSVKTGDDVHQVIYVTYEQDGDADGDTDVKIKGNEKFIIPNLIEQDVPLQDDSLGLPGQPLQITDDQGNPIHFTMQDGSALQITTTDGQSLHVTTKDGQMIPVQITTSDGQPLATELPAAPDDQIPTLEYTPDGQNLRVIPSYIAEGALESEYLNIA